MTGWDIQHIGDGLTSSKPVTTHLLSLRLPSERDGVPSIPVHPEYGLDILSWLQDEVTDGTNRATVEEAWMSVVPAEAGLYCLRLHPFWSQTCKK